MDAQLWWRQLLENTHLEDREQDGRTIHWQRLL